MTSLSSNDWPALAPIQNGRAPNAPVKKTAVVGPTITDAPLIDLFTHWSSTTPALAHSTANPTMPPPPGLQQLQYVYPQHQSQQNQPYHQPQQYQQKIQYHQTPVYNNYAPVSYPLMVQTQPPNASGRFSSAIPIKHPVQPMPNMYQQQSQQYQQHPPQQPMPHSNFIPRPPPGLQPRRTTPISNTSAITTAPRPAHSPSQTAASSISVRDGQSTTFSSQTSVSSPPVQSKAKAEEVEVTLEGPLDKYAATYVPSWLRDVNQDNHFTLLPLPEEPNYDYDAFVSGFLPRSLIFSDPDEEVVAQGQVSDSKQHSNGRSDYDKEEEEEEEREEEAHLVKADSSWLKGDAGDLLQELESSGKGVAGDQVPDSAHASVGALSQQHDNEMGVRVEESSTTVLQGSSEVRSFAPLPPLRPDSYASRLGQLLQVELAHRRDVLAAQSLYDVQLSVYPEEKDDKMTAPAWSKDHLYSLRLPGVREDYPNLVTGDLLQLRVLASQSYSWLRIAFEAKVYVVHKVAGVVIVKCDALAGQLKKLFTSVQAARFNILFTSSAFRGSAETIAGIERVGKHLSRPKSLTGGVLQRWLFPRLSDEEVPEDAALEERTINWYDGNLNAEQKGIARAITLVSHRRIPFLIHGPPGTGKTKTLTETTLQILQHHDRPRILLTAPSVTAADTLALRLAPHLGPRDMTRINDPRRTFEEVPEALLVYCTVEESATGAARFGLPDWKKLLQTKVTIIATHDVHILHLCKVSNLELGRWQGTTISAMMGESLSSAKLHWTHLLVDEAGQSSEAEMANALLLVVPSLYHTDSKALPVVVLCGDTAQLGPQIDSHFARSHGLDVSLLERLSKRKLYHRQLKVLRAKARQALLRGDYGPDKMGDESGVKGSIASSAAHLVRNYRARNASLLHVVSMLFYDDCLLPCAPSSLLDLSRWTFPNSQLPLLFEHINSKDEWVDEGASFYNAEEIDKVLEICISLTSKGSGLVMAKEIAVLTPYREQVWRIRLKLRKVGLGAISVGNIEVYQGAEHKISILSTVRSTPRFLDTDAKRSLGLVYERKRLCVALSRAQEALIVVGNADLLRTDPYWRSFISYAKRNLALRGQNVDMQEEDGDQVGALEYAARSGGPSSEKDTAYLAGRMAASALYEDEEDDDDDDDDIGR